MKFSDNRGVNVSIDFRVHYVRSNGTSSLDHREFLLHLHEVRKGKWQNHDHQAYISSLFTCGGYPETSPREEIDASEGFGQLAEHELEEGFFFLGGRGLAGLGGSG